MEIACYQSIKMIEITSGNKTKSENANCKIVESISGANNKTILFRRKKTINILDNSKQSDSFRAALDMCMCVCVFARVECVHGHSSFSSVLVVYFQR